MASSGISEALPPWVLTGETYQFIGWSWTPQLPPGSFHTQEEETITASSSSYLARTPYAVQLFRYKTSPVGPYDEIMFIPGFYKTAVKDAKGKISFDHSPRITRIYVSTEVSIYNGRKNWNIPKHKADFDFQYLPTGDIDIKVTLPGEADRPFFAAKITPSKRIPSFPLSTDWLPVKLDVLQPPLPAVNEVATATQQWQKTPLRITQKGAQVAYIKPLLNNGKDYANGIDFPNIAPLSAGIFCKDATIDFMEPATPEVVVLPSAGSSKRD